MVLLGFTGFYWVLLGFTGFYWVLLCFTGFYWVFKKFNITESRCHHSDWLVLVYCALHGPWLWFRLVGSRVTEFYRVFTEISDPK